MAISLCWSTGGTFSFPSSHDSHRLSNDLFTCLCVSSVRSLSVDERHKAQNNSSHRCGRRSWRDQREETSTDRCFTEDFRKAESSFSNVTLRPEQERAVARLRAWMQPVRTDCLRESRQVVEVGQENLGEKNAYFQMAEACTGHIDGTVLRQCTSGVGICGR